MHETTLRSLVLLIQWYVLDYEIPYCMRMNRVRCGLRKHIRLTTNCFDLEGEVFQAFPQRRIWSQVAGCSQKYRTTFATLAVRVSSCLSTDIE